MKTIAITLALMGSVCLGADSDPVYAADPVEPPHLPAAAAQALARQISAAAAVAEDVAAEAIGKVESALTKDSKLEWKEREGGFGAGGGLANGFELGFGAAGRRPEQPLIVRTSELGPETLSNLHEDLSVMSRILTKTVEREVGRAGRELALGIVLSTLPGSRRPHNIYLEGYGALFMLNVGFPLVPPPATEDEPEEKPSNTTWEQAKRELYGQKPGSVRLPPHLPQSEFNSEQVENLKKELLASLKNAANIRELKPEESITLVLIGSRVSGAEARLERKSARGENRRVEVFAYADGGRGAGRETTMTIRVKKSDADAFSNGTVDLEEFTKRASVSTY